MISSKLEEVAPSLSRRDPIPSVNKKTITPSNNKYETLQVLRFIAALSVIILHSMFYTQERLDPSFALYTQGSNGVPLFFAISGFVMIISSESLIKKKDGWKIFAIKRIIRIVPIYWIVTTYKLILLLIASSLILHTQLDISNLIKSYFFIPALNIDHQYRPFYGVGWTLNFEVFFYLLFTFALALKARPMILLSVIFISLSILSIYKTPSWPAAGFYVDNIMLYFLYGMIVAKLILNKIKLNQTLAVIFISLGLLYLYLPLPLTRYTNSGILKNISIFLVIYGGACIETIRGKKLPSWMVYLGGASYSLYLIHPSVAPFASTFFKLINYQSSWLSVIIGVVISVIAGVIFYKLVEKPLTNFITKWAKTKNLI